MQYYYTGSLAAHLCHDCQEGVMSESVSMSEILRCHFRHAKRRSSLSFRETPAYVWTIPADTQLAHRSVIVAGHPWYKAVAPTCANARQFFRNGVHHVVQVPAPDGAAAHFQILVPISGSPFATRVLLEVTGANCIYWVPTLSPQWKVIRDVRAK
ncbi:hypothetical protein EDD16DRAFT_1525502 [Pisolithus croceorrhizus]|nr:hypothetical protein EDD16DRAFT_1525502 [Pisolithus croceorrhizus]